MMRFSAPVLVLLLTIAGVHGAHAINKVGILSAQLTVRDSPVPGCGGGPTDLLNVVLSHPIVGDVEPSDFVVVIGDKSGKETSRIAPLCARISPNCAIPPPDLSSGQIPLNCEALPPPPGQPFPTPEGNERTNVLLQGDFTPGEYGAIRIEIEGGFKVDVDGQPVEVFDSFKGKKGTFLNEGRGPRVVTSSLRTLNPLRSSDKPDVDINGCAATFPESDAYFRVVFSTGTRERGVLPDVLGRVGRPTNVGISQDLTRAKKMFKIISGRSMQIVGLADPDPDAFVDVCLKTKKGRKIPRWMVLKVCASGRKGIEEYNIFDGAEIICKPQVAVAKRS